ncbi:ABC transporter ATP-binding protein [Marmoricola endophyticus]|uniref:ABC transporter ATP-binding protein n=1 Tax=Marmoricola endophyticus TaxID=2040280 RepID=A0A917F668_9ACTN|nr:ATP-binding cassette domain-containing protein [Marmoricola endophyticus]GGF47642.1 ABC transporter ATP-binding protein [Marmoricola endophyticus]
MNQSVGGIALELAGVTVWVPSGERLVEDIDWTVRHGETWALLGPNGAGKTTLLSLADTSRFPSAGRVTILGRTMGRVDIWTLRAELGAVNPSTQMPEDLNAEDVVLTGRTGSVHPMWKKYTADDHHRADELMTVMSCQHLRGRQVNGLSQGERGRLRIARSLMSDPELLLLDEPATGLDLMAREELLSAISVIRTHMPQIAIVLVSHHIEELPASTSHALLLRGGRIVSKGPVAQSLTSSHVSACFGGDITIRRHLGRWSAQLADAWSRKE